MALLQIEDLSLGYGSKTIFKDINASEEEGCLISLLGSNGRGKSTLLRTIARLEEIYEPSKGKILYNGKEASAYSKKEMSQMVSFVSPVTERAPYLKVKDLVSINSYYRTDWMGSISKSEEEKILKALKMVGLEGFEERECTSLSDGEFQRATIAGAIVQDSRIILLDEPTAFLDIANKYLITGLLKTIAEKKLIIFSTHDLQLALQVCDRLWVMTSEGFFCGSPAQLTENGQIEKMFDVEGVRFDKEKQSFVPTKQ